MNKKGNTKMKGVPTGMFVQSAPLDGPWPDETASPRPKCYLKAPGRCVKVFVFGDARHTCVRAHYTHMRPTNARAHTRTHEPTNPPTCPHKKHEIG